MQNAFRKAGLGFGLCAILTTMGGAGLYALAPFGAETTTLTPADLDTVRAIVKEEVAKVIPPPAPVDPPVDPNKLTLEITGPDTALPGEMFELRAKTNSKHIRWKSKSSFKPYESGSVIVFSSPVAGSFDFELMGHSDSEVDSVTKTVVVGTPVPPTPVPVPPAPVTGPFSLFVIYDSNKQTPEVGQMAINLRAQAGADYLKSKGHTLEFLDPSVHAARLAKLGISGVADIPFLAVIDKSGKVVSRTQLTAPYSATAFLDLVKKAGG